MTVVQAVPCPLMTAEPQDSGKQLWSRDVIKGVQTRGTPRNIIFHILSFVGRQFVLFFRRKLWCVITVVVFNFW